MRRKIPITHRVYSITGFVVSGYLFFIPGIIKLPDENIKKWEMVKIPCRILKPVYLWLEFWRRLKSKLRG